MFLIYSLLFTLAFILMLPLLILRREKYAAGFSQRLGNYPKFTQDSRPVIWLHCVSVGEANAARPLVEALKTEFTNHRLVVSTTTKSGQSLAQNIFANTADAIFYFPFDWKFSVRRALKTFRPNVVLMMETEIWPRFYREAKTLDVRLAIVNGRLSAKSFAGYSKLRGFVAGVLQNVDLALMQNKADAERIASLGLAKTKIEIIGNLKFDLADDNRDNALAETFRTRFHITGNRPLIVAASTHAPEEKAILDIYRKLVEPANRPRLLLAPRHPERFEDVAKLIENSGFSFVRSSIRTDGEANADIILLDSIGELRAVYQLATVVFVGGSLIPHGGQSVLEPAAAGKAIITGPFTHNFAAVIDEFLKNKALVQLPESDMNAALFAELLHLLTKQTEREAQGLRALSVMQSNRGATSNSLAAIKKLIEK